MREFVVTAEMKSDAESSRTMMRLLADELARVGFVFRDHERMELKQPYEQVTRDGDIIFRQWDPS